jgi:hypothetical protein
LPVYLFEDRAGAIDINPTGVVPHGVKQNDRGLFMRLKPVARGE